MQYLHFFFLMLIKLTFIATYYILYLFALIMYLLGIALPCDLTLTEFSGRQQQIFYELRDSQISVSVISNRKRSNF